jgi:hypothetical protein
MTNPSPLESSAGFLDTGFLRRVYRTSLIVAFLAGIFLWEGLGSRAALGFLSGVALSLLMLAGVEWAVRSAIRSGRHTRIVLGSLLKLPLVLGLLVLLYLAARRGWINLIWVLVGFALPHGVLVLKLVGMKVLELSRQDTSSPRKGTER